MRITDEFVFFYGGNCIYSQHYKCKFAYKGLTFNCAEQAMMFEKAMLFEDDAMANAILKSEMPSEQKRFGRKVQNFNSGLWNKHKTMFVTFINYAKFSQNPELRDEMLSMGNRMFVEASPRDRVWGIGMGENAPGVENTANWKGQNLLGFCLSEARNLIVNQWHQHKGMK